MDQGRDPCPWRILEDVGSAFIIGAVGTTVWNTGKGWRNSPRGERIFGMTTAVKARAPVVAGGFAVWGGLFSTFDCTFAALRQKEDPWNAIASGALTGGLLAVRGGKRSFITNAVMGGTLLAMMEGLGILITNMFTPKAQDGPVGLISTNAAPPPVTAIVGGTGSMELGDADHSFDVSANTSTFTADELGGGFGKDSLYQDKYR